MDLKEIKAVIDLMTKNGLTEFELEKGDVKLRVKRGPSGEFTTSAVPIAPAAGTQPLPQIVLAAPAPAAAPAAASVSASAPSAELKIISPMVGTFYRSPSPDSPSYIEPGQEVNEDTVVLIIVSVFVI
jgi:acetyl-CoA carboxylase biotin carboxyl carrier protein